MSKDKKTQDSKNDQKAKTASIVVSDSELQVLNILWENSPLTAREIVSAVSGSQNWHEKTVKTLISRLVKKGAVGFEAQGRKYQYFPLINKQHFVASQTNSFVNRMFKGSISSLVAAFAKKEDLSTNEIESLKKLLKDIEK